MIMEEYYLNEKQLAEAISEVGLGRKSDDMELKAIYDYWPSEYCDIYEPWNEGGFAEHKVYFQGSIPYVVLATGERRYFRGEAYRDTYTFDIAENDMFDNLLHERLFPDEFTSALFWEERNLRDRFRIAYRGVKLQEQDVATLRASLISLEEMLRACEFGDLTK